MEEIKKFPLSHTALYCKGWYEVSKNPFDDLRKTLTADGYSGEFFSDSDIVSLLLGKIDDYFELFKKSYNPLGFQDIYRHIDKYSWLYAEMKDKSFEYKVWGWIRFQICNLHKDDFELVEPDYNILPRKRFYPKEWLDGVLYKAFESCSFGYDFSTEKEYKKLSKKILNKSLNEIIIKYPSMLEEFENKKSNIINLVLDEYTAKFINKHKHLFNND